MYSQIFGLARKLEIRILAINGEYWVLLNAEMNDPNSSLQQS